MPVICSSFVKQFFDLQIVVDEEVKTVLKYLQYDNVHLAIDPEFEVQGLDVRPGKVIGHITGEEVNQVQALRLATQPPTVWVLIFH